MYLSANSGLPHGTRWRLKMVEELSHEPHNGVIDSVLSSETERQTTIPYFNLKIASLRFRPMPSFLTALTENNGDLCSCAYQTVY